MYDLLFIVEYVNIRMNILRLFYTYKYVYSIQTSSLEIIRKHHEQIVYLFFARAHRDTDFLLILPAFTSAFFKNLKYVSSLEHDVRTEESHARFS